MTEYLYLLDTNILSDLIRDPQGKARRSIERVGEKCICTSAIVASELCYGVEKKGSARLSAKVAQLLDEMAVLPYESPADAEYRRIRTELETAGRPIGSNDLLIAAHACSQKLTLVTGNVAEFERVPGLRLENWLA